MDGRTMRTEHKPHPMAAHPNQMRGGKSLEVTVAGIWQRICQEQGKVGQ